MLQLRHNSKRKLPAIWRAFELATYSTTFLRVHGKYAILVIGIAFGAEAMIFPLGVQFHEAQRLLVWRPRGVLNQEVISDIVAVLNELEVELHGPFNRFSDTSGVDQIDLNYEYIIGVSTYRRLAYAHHPPIKSAILAINPTLIDYANLHRLVTAGSPIEVRVFPDDRLEIAQWLGVPLELVTAERRFRNIAG